MTTNKYTEKSGSDYFNSLPIEQRKILCIMSYQDQIRDIKIEKGRALNAHAKHVTEINKHLSKCEKSLHELLKELNNI